MRKEENLKRQMDSFFGENGKSEIRTFFAPGRVNLIGEHTDYNGGYVFPAGLTLGITGCIRQNFSNIIRLRSLDFDGEVTVDLSGPIYNDPKDKWGNYPKGVIKLLQEEGYEIPGCDILYSSDLPDGAGLSSSAAIETLTAFMLLNVIHKKNIDKVWLAKFCQRVENEFINVQCGIMDQFSVAMGKEGAALLIDCKTMLHRYIALDLEAYSLLIINTNKKRELTESKYNERRQECEQALKLLNKEKKINDLCEADIELVEKCIQDSLIKRRAMHVVSENIRVHESIKFLEKGDLKGFGKKMKESHESLRFNYEVTGKELDSIVDAANSFEGCIGARMTGAGFGGCAIALVETDLIESFTTEVGEVYKKETGLTASFYVSKIAQGVRELLINKVSI